MGALQLIRHRTLHMNQFLFNGFDLACDFIDLPSVRLQRDHIDMNLLVGATFNGIGRLLNLESLFRYDLLS
jgi:hypothetical protein